MSLIKKASRLATLCMMFLMNRKPPPTPPKGGEFQLVQRRISKEIIANLQQIGLPRKGESPNSLRGG